MIFDSSPTGLSYIDLTGRFPYLSVRGNEYILVAYRYDANAILAQPFKSRQAENITAAWEKINEIFESVVIKLTTSVIYNEASNDLKNALLKDNIKHQLVPPYAHRTNLAERAIQTFKQHFKAGIALVGPNFPLDQWDQLTQQAIITLNRLRSSTANPKLSSYMYVFGEFDFNTTPLAPPGTRVVAHTKPSV